MAQSIGSSPLKVAKIEWLPLADLAVTWIEIGMWPSIIGGDKVTRVTWKYRAKSYKTRQVLKNNTIASSHIVVTASFISVRVEKQYLFSTSTVVHIFVQQSIFYPAV